MMERYLSGLRIGALAVVPFLAACNVGGGSTVSNGPSGQLTVSPNSLTFAGTGAAYAQNVTITTSLPTNTITVTPDASCGTGNSALVTIANPQPNGNTFTTTVTPQNAGTCNITLTSASGGSAPFTVIVNNGTVTISGRHK